MTTPPSPPPVPPAGPPQGPPRQGPPRQGPPPQAYRPGPPPAPGQGPHQAPHQGPPPVRPAGPAPAPSARPAPSHAQHQSTERTRTYPCSNCGGALQFDAAAQVLVCPQCGNRQPLVEGAARPVAEHDMQAAMRWLRDRAAQARTRTHGDREVVCQSCGGRTTFTGTLTSTRCPYCATPVQRDDVQDAPDRLPVDGVLPFAIPKPDAEQRLAAWVGSRRFAPTEFKKYNRTGSFASVYATYFTYDAWTHTSYRGERGDDRTVTTGSGDNERTETVTDWTSVWGDVENTFDDLAVLANDGFEDKFVRALEPWPTQQARPYSPEYVAGHLSRTYDRDVEQCFPVAQQRMDAEIRRTIELDIGGDRQRIHGVDTRYGPIGFKHLLMPIWLLTVIYAEKPFQVMINGVTGEVQGRRPYSAVKIALTITAAVVAIVAIVILISLVTR